MIVDCALAGHIGASPTATANPPAMILPNAIRTPSPQWGAAMTDVVESVQIR